MAFATRILRSAKRDEGLMVGVDAVVSWLCFSVNGGLVFENGKLGRRGAGFCSGEERETLVWY